MDAKAVGRVGALAATVVAVGLVAAGLALACSPAEEARFGEVVAADSGDAHRQYPFTGVVERRVV